MPRGNPQNLRVSTPEEARINGSKGGKKSVEVRREKKLMSQIYGDLLAKKHKLGDEEITGENLLEKVALKVLARGDSSSVSLMKEIREATEGSRLSISGILAALNPAQLSPAERDRIAGELEGYFGQSVIDRDQLEQMETDGSDDPETDEQ